MYILPIIFLSVLYNIPKFYEVETTTHCELLLDGTVSLDTKRRVWGVEIWCFFFDESMMILTIFIIKSLILTPLPSLIHPETHHSLPRLMCTYVTFAYMCTLKQMAIRIQDNFFRDISIVLFCLYFLWKFYFCSINSPRRAQDNLDPKYVSIPDSVIKD